MWNFIEVWTLRHYALGRTVKSTRFYGLHFVAVRTP